MKQLITILILIGALTGCNTAPIAQAELDNADYGQPMTTQQCANVAEQFIRSTLKDPMSAQFTTYSKCVKGVLRDGLINGGKTHFGYLQKGTVNAKNSYGGYVGFRSYQAIIRDEIVVSYCIINEDGICM